MCVCVCVCVSERMSHCVALDALELMTLPPQAPPLLIYRVNTIQLTIRILRNLAGIGNMWRNENTSLENNTLKMPIFDSKIDMKSV